MMIAAILALALAAEPPVVSPAEPTAPKADWIVRPTAQEVAAAFPPRAKGAGKAVIACRVTAAGTLEACEVASEEPAGQGFGAAALKLAPAFRMAPDSAVAGASVQVPVVWAVAKTTRPGPKGIRKQDIPDSPGMGSPNN